MSDSLISALIQAPFVLVVVYLVHRFLSHLNARDLEWRAFTDEMHNSLGDRLEALTEAIDRLSHLVISHDAATRGIQQQPAQPPSPRPTTDADPIPLRRAR